MKIHLLVDYYKNPRPERAEELDFCFLENINSKEFDHIHIFAQSELPTRELPNNVKLSSITGRLTYQYYLEYAKNNIPEGDIIVLSNADIFFDESILKVKELDLSNKVLALTRWCSHQGHWIDEQDQLTRYEIDHRSQDVWVWKNPLVIKRGNYNFNIGVLGCDNKVAYQLYLDDYQVWNPSFSIICYHKHKERDDIKDYISPIRTWLSRPYLLIRSCTLEDIKKENYHQFIEIE